MELSIFEKLFLFAINPKSDKIYFTASAGIEYGMAGSIMFELLQNNYITINNDIVTVNKSTQAKELYLLKAIEVLSQKSGKSIKKSTSYLANHFNEIKSILIKNLTDAEIIETYQKSILLIFTSQRYKILNQKIIDKYIDEIHNTLSIKTGINQETLMLMNLLEACNLSKKVFPNKEEHKAFKNWIKGEL